MKNRFLDKFRSGEPSVGTFFEMGGPAVGEMIALTELDYFVIDGEHGPYDVLQAADIIRAAEGAGTAAPFVRVKDSQRNSILRMLDVGAKGLIIPQVQSVDEVRRIVEYGKYYPVGSRGFAPTRNSLYGCSDDAKGSVQEYFDRCNTSQLLIPQCETMGCLEAIEEIAAVDGVDGIFVGPYDLSVAMGAPAQFDRPEFAAALKRVLEAVQRAGKFCIIYADTEDAAVKRFDEGFDSVALSMDCILYRRAINGAVAAIKGAL